MWYESKRLYKTKKSLFKNWGNKREIFKNTDKFYRETYGVDYGGNRKYDNGDERQHGLPLAVFFKHVMGNKDLHEMLLALWNRGVAIGPKYDFLKEIVGTYENNCEMVRRRGM